MRIRILGLVIGILIGAPAAAVTAIVEHEQVGPRVFTAAAARVATAEAGARMRLSDTPDLENKRRFDLAAANAGVGVGARPELPRNTSPFVVGGLLAMLLVVVVDRASRRRSIAIVPMIDRDFEQRVPVIIAPAPARAAFRDPIRTAADETDPLRHFRPDAPPVKAAAVERSRPDYIRVDDSVEVWTPARVEAERAPATSAKRRRTDAPGADYRFHRLNADGSVKTAERHKFVTDLDAQRFAETVGHGDAVEIWLGDRRLTTIPPDFFS